MSSNVGNVQVGIGMILFCLVIAVPVFVVAYRAGRTRGRRGQWQDPRMKDIPLKDFLQPGAAWYVLLAGAIVLFLIGLVGPPARSGAYVHPSQR